jgi:hypothetical protein
MTEPAGPLATIPYHQEAFHQTLSEVQSRLAELRYIDRAIEYLEQQQAEVELEHRLSGNYFLMEVRLGETVPFTRTFSITTPYMTLPWEYPPWETVEDVKMDRINQRLDELRGEAGTWAATNIETVRSRVEPITSPSTTRYDDEVLNPIYDARVQLQDEVSSDFGKLRATIGHWEGEAAESFQTNFYHPFEDTVLSHDRLFQALYDGVVVAREILGAAQHSLMSVVHYTSARLYRQLELRSLDSSDDSPSTIPVIAATGFSLLSAVLGRAGLWVAGSEAISGAIALGTELVERGNSTVALLGTSADQILFSLDDALRAILSNMSEQYDDLAVNVDTVLNRVRDLRDASDGNDGRLIPIRPALVNGVNADTFYLPDVG